MEWLVSLVGAANSLTPLAIIGLLVIILLYQAKNARHVEGARKEVQTIRTNDLHELPEIVATLQRIEVKLSEEFSYIRARLNGHK